MTDAQLLREYAEHGKNAAFAEIVTRHTNLVYSAALRQVLSPDEAAEVAQRVFIGLAQGAQKLSLHFAEHASLAGWLSRSARNISLNLRRDDFRRHSRERQAMENFETISENAPDWEQLHPVLDEAMSELNEPDYDALVLRFFQNRDLRTVGIALGVSDDTAQKRVTRALEKLRENLSRRGIKGPAAALTIVLSANAVQAAPIGLAATISTAAILGGTTIATTTTATITKTIVMTTLQKTLITATLVTAVGTGIYEARQATQLREQNQTLQQQQAPLAKQISELQGPLEQIRQLREDRDEATNRLASLTNEIAKVTRDSSELLKLRGEVGLLRRQNQILAQANDKPENTGTVQHLDKGFGALGEYLPVENVSDAGNGTAEALLQTFVWAIREGKVDRLQQLATPFGGQIKPGDVVGEISETEAAIFKMMQSTFTNAAGFRLSSKTSDDGQRYDVRLDSEARNGNETNEFLKNFNLSFVLEHKAEGWSFEDPSKNSGSK
ncbi:MAG: sigma-70 family RNA polymerase sigma factor [Verrucomicrobiota bacterium]